MDKEYLKQFTNPNLAILLLHKDNISPLEDILNKEGQRLQKLRKLEKEGKLDFGHVLKYKELKETLSQVKKEVDSFLDISGSEIPDIYSFNLFIPEDNNPALPLYIFGVACTIFGIKNIEFDKFLGYGMLSLGCLLYGIASLIHLKLKATSFTPSSDSINIENKRRVISIPGISHEYTHHVQKIKKIVPDEKKAARKYEVLKEGHARGVQRYISDLYSQKESNPAFLYNTTDITVGELKGVYSWMCFLLGLKPNKNLLRVESKMDETEYYMLSRIGMPTTHAVGNTLFYLQELIQGNKIYKEMLKGTFKFN